MTYSRKSPSSSTSDAEHGVLDAIGERVRFARRRFGYFEVIDFVAVLFGYTISGERTVEGFYERLRPWASAKMRALRA
jgi:hypothetical protein